MSRKWSSCLAALFIFAMAFYLAKDSAQSAANVMQFIELHLNNPQHYLYIVSLYAISVLAFRKMPFLQAEYRVRLRDNLFFYLFQKMLVTSLLLTLFLLFSYGLSAVVLGYAWAFSGSILIIFVKLFCFILACHTVYVLVYFGSGKEMLGVFSVLAVNLFVLAVLYGLQYYVLRSALTTEKQMTVLILFIAMVNISGLSFLAIRMERKECLI